MGSRKYASAAAFRVALDGRLNSFSKAQSVDLMRIRRQVAFDRFLSRLFVGPDSSKLVLKGGYAIELRIKNARSTKDIDLCVNIDKNETDLTKRILEKAASINLDDFFVFLVGEKVIDLQNAPYGGARFPIECRIAGKKFINFSIDMAIGDVWLDPHPGVAVYQWLEFAGINTPLISCISVEQQIAEKIHSYTLPRETGNSRVKDLVDIMLLVVTSSIDNCALLNALEKTFARRATHSIPQFLDEPPKTWNERFKVLAESCGISIDIKDVYNSVSLFYKELLMRK